MIIVCPRCRSGNMDSDHGQETACWYCSNWLPCYVCDGKACGAKLCAPCIERILSQKGPPQLARGAAESDETEV